MDMVDSNYKEMRGKACDVWCSYTSRTIAILHDLYVTSENATGPRLTNASVSQNSGNDGRIVDFPKRFTRKTFGLGR